LLRAGRPFPAAIQLLSGGTGGAVRRLLNQLNRAISRGQTVGEAFAGQQPEVSPLESSIIGACDRTGRVDQGCAYLSGYYSRLEEARKSVIRKSLYPAFALHFGVFVTGLPKYVLNQDSAAYLKDSFGVLALVYIYGFAIVLLAGLLLFEGARLAPVDRLLRLVPGVGKMRRAFALSRFCATYEMQLQSGVNVINSLLSAAQASQSGLVSAAVAKAVPLVRGGAQVGPLLSGSPAFTADMVRGIMIGEETGSLDAELKRMSDSFQEEAMSRLDFLAGVLSRGLYLAVICFTGYRIVQGYAGYLHQADSMFGQ
jgi:type IV pilus assembly protein PilC